jgi:hypothetical protein
VYKISWDCPFNSIEEFSEMYAESFSAHKDFFKGTVSREFGEMRVWGVNLGHN